MEGGGAGGELRAARTTAVTALARTARTRWRPAVGAWLLWALAMLGVAVIFWLDHLLRRAGRPELAPLSASAAPYVLAVMSAATVGAVLASRRPRHPVGGPLPAADYAASYTDFSILLWAACLGFIMVLTPTGSLPSPRWRRWASGTLAALVVEVVSSALLPLDPPYQAVANPLAVPALAGPLRVVNAVSWVVTGLAVPVGAASLVVRFRRARGVERLQLRWLTLAAGSAAVAVVALAALVPTGNELLLGWVTAVCVALLPVATGASILRYRLYDLDRIISRTLAYGLLTLLLGGAYAGVVLGLGQLLGQGRSLVVAAATLALAAVFRPARARVQRAVDRRFNRRRYDAAATIQAFAGRLRQQVDLDALRAELLAVVDQTMQPTRTSLWLRPPAGASSAAAPLSRPTTAAGDRTAP